MSPRTLVIGVIVALVAVSWCPASPDDDWHSLRRSSLRTLEGTVVDVSSVEAEGHLEVVAVRLDTGDGTRAEILLAPRSVLDEVAFAVAPGDTFRARVFVGDEGPMKAHKVMNVTRETEVRLRTLHEIPLWDKSGKWEGGDARRHGHGGRGYRGGRGPGR